MSWTFVNPALRAKIITQLPLPNWLLNHRRRDYICAMARATPEWVDRKTLARLERAAQDKTRRTGIRHVLDHIVPITHPYVCGLTVPWNLRVVPARVNAAKGNRWAPDQEDWCLGVEQFELELR